MHSIHSELVQFEVNTELHSFFSFLISFFFFPKWVILWYSQHKGFVRATPH